LITGCPKRVEARAPASAPSPPRVADLVRGAGLRRQGILTVEVEFHAGVLEIVAAQVQMRRRDLRRMLGSSLSRSLRNAADTHPRIPALQPIAFSGPSVQ
jgi:hypothetical protein